MGTLKIEAGDELIMRFKKKAMEKYGYQKGSLKKAAVDLINKWLSEEKMDWSKLKGVIKSSESSVDLQHKAWKKVD